MKYFKWLIGGLLGGAIGAAIWAAVTVTTQREIGWIAWGVGILAGLGVRMAAGEDDGVPPGVLAAVIALASVAGGKFLAVHFLIEKVVAEAGVPQISDQDVTAGIADEVVGEMVEQGKTLKWPEGSTLETATKPEEYPKGVWAEATKRFQALTVEERDRIKQEMVSRRDAFINATKDEVRSKAFAESFSPMDAVFFLFAVATAFKLGSGLASQS